MIGQRNIYKAQNGQYRNIIYRVNGGAFIETTAQFKQYLQNVPRAPSIWSNRTVISPQISEPVNVLVDQGTEEYKPIGGVADRFADKYSVSGWFKFSGIYSKGADSSKPARQFLFRFTMNNKTDNLDGARIGDDILTVMLNPDGEYQFISYQHPGYIKGSPVVKPVQTENMHTGWHFIYFAYNKQQALLTYNVVFKQSTKTNVFKSISHYFAPQFFFLIRDSRNPNFNGQMALVTVVLG